jgi:UDP-N-acetylglucosamine 2-epimerase (non-hydrolysing)
VLPLPPRALRQADRHGLRGLLDRLRPVELVDRPTFLALAREARLVVSDSGAVQEECAVLRRPLAALGSGERPELVAAGFTRPVAPDAGLALRLRELVADDTWPARLAHRASPYGDGTASEAIARHTHDLLGLGAALRSRLQPAPPARAPPPPPDSVTPEE